MNTLKQYGGSESGDERDMYRSLAQTAAGMWARLQAPGAEDALPRGCSVTYRAGKVNVLAHGDAGGEQTTLYSDADNLWHVVTKRFWNRGDGVYDVFTTDRAAVPNAQYQTMREECVLDDKGMLVSRTPEEPYGPVHVLTPGVCMQLERGLTDLTAPNQRAA